MGKPPAKVVTPQVDEPGFFEQAAEGGSEMLSDAYNYLGDLFSSEETKAAPAKPAETEEVEEELPVEVKKPFKLHDYEKVNKLTLKKAAPYWNDLESASRVTSIPPDFMQALIEQENPWWDLKRKGPKTRHGTASGLTQMLDGTIREMGYDPASFEFQPKIQFLAAGKYIEQNWYKYEDWNLVLAAYNAGPGRTDAWLKGEKSLPEETINYIKQIQKHYRKIGGGTMAGWDLDYTPPKWHKRKK